MNPSTTLRIAMTQMTSGPDRQANLDAVLKSVDEAQKQGAAWVLTPETCNVMDEDFERILKETRPEAEDPFINRLKDEAKARRLWLLIGSAVVKPDEPGEARLANRSLLINNKGEVVARYDKLHLFDALVGDGVGRYHESARYRPGVTPVLAETPWGKLGMSVCYDLRFPYLYSYYAKAGADFLTMPAAFTQKTGMAHWHVLLRARAIENGCFVIAPAQTGKHSEKRLTYGHSLAISPWGEVLADGGEAAHTVIAELPLNALSDARDALPCLTHHRPLG